MTGVDHHGLRGRMLADNGPHVTPVKQISDVSMPLVLSALGGTAAVVLAVAVYCTCRCWRAKRVDHSADNTPILSQPPLPDCHHSHQQPLPPPPAPPPLPHSSPFAAHDNMHRRLQRQEATQVAISQSTPDLLDDVNKTEYTKEEAKIGKSHYKTVVKQTTMPTMSQRHQSFHRQLSHKLDFSNIEFTIHSVKYKEQPEAKLKPELYRQNAQETVSGGVGGGGCGAITEEARTTCGSLSFSIQYLHAENQLIVNLLSADKLPPKDFSGTSDPYVKIYLLPDRKRKCQTKVHRKTLSPEFNESFVFSLPYTELEDRVLQFSVYDFDRFSRHDLIGVVMVRDLTKVTDGAPYERHFTMDIISVQQENVELGDLMLSLCYLPTAGRLTVTIIKARNLKAMDITGTSDPYVKVSLMCQGKRIKKKKTSVKRNTLNPVYNEAIVFDVPQENVEEVCLVIKVIDYDRVGSNELMGVVAVGPQIVGQGRHHWFEMLENSRKPVAQWYPIQENIPPGQLDMSPTGKTGCLRTARSYSEGT